MSANKKPLSGDDRLDIMECIAGISLCADLKDWDGLAALYDDTVQIDYRSLMGGEPATIDHATFIRFFQQSTSFWDMGHHHISNVRITGEGDEAQTVCAVSARNRKDGRPWAGGGFYMNKLRRTKRGWRIYAHVFKVEFEDDPTNIKPAWLDFVSKLAA